MEGTPERIEFQAGSGKIVWKRDPGAPEEMQTVWTRWVPDYLQGETPNGLDDNGNGLADEEGLAFNLESSQVFIRLTLERTDSKNVQYVRTNGRRATCRN